MEATGSLEDGAPTSLSGPKVEWGPVVLTEVVVRDLGVIERTSLLLGPRMTALTGETGAGKTMIVEALSLLLGGRAESLMVRVGADEARVDGRFDTAEGERILTRVVSRNGRSRAYIDGQPVTVGQLADAGKALVDIHAQHGHQSLLSAASQRDSLDLFGRIDVEPLHAARTRLHDIDRQLAALGGDERARTRELDLLRFQYSELDAAALDHPDEDQSLAASEALLANAVAHRDAAATALEVLRGENGARDAIGAAIAAVHRREPFVQIEQRLVAALADIDDLIAEVRSLSESIDEDPEQLAALRVRRQLLRDLQRKYGDDVAAMIAYRDEVSAKILELSSHEARAASLEQQRVGAVDAVRSAAHAVKVARQQTADPLASAVQKRLGALAMPKARLSVRVAESLDAVGVDDGSDVCFLLAANPGAPLLPLAKVASGGELARSMLALRLALLEGRVALGAMPDTLVFDEVDAGIGGAAAVAVGEALAELGRDGQVLVVTHLAQVAAKADHHVAVTKAQGRTSTATSVTPLTGEQRVSEIARMLGGSSTSEVGRLHAEELLASQPRTAPTRGRRGGSVKSRG